jgi:signal transduction histidine kinase
MSRGCDITVDLPPDLPPVHGDARDLGIMLDNLMSNAIKFSSPGSTVHVGVSRQGDHITIKVRDEGIGIHPDMLEKIFQRFYQVDSGDRRRFEGTGLGLALAREIVNAHGGRVWAESRVGRGSTFHVSLPVCARQDR